MNPYTPPNSQLLSGNKTASVTRLLGILSLVIPITFLASWLMVPYMNGTIASLFYPKGSDDYWSVRYAADILNTFIIFFIGSSVAALLVKGRPIQSTFPVGFLGLAAFFYELGGFDCIGRCGPPLWYDLLSFTKHISAALLAGIIFRRNSHLSNK